MLRVLTDEEAKQDRIDKRNKIIDFIKDDDNNEYVWRYIKDLESYIENKLREQS